MLLEIDWQGAAQVRRLIPDSVHIFILPPSLEALRGAADQARRRIRRRSSSSGSTAAREEMRHCGEFDYVIMNQDFARAVDDLSVIVRAARLTAPRSRCATRRLLQRFSTPNH